MTFHQDHELEASARQLRKLLGIEFQTRPDMITVVVKLKGIKNYERVPDTSMPDDEVRFDPDERILYIRESTFVAGNGMFAIESERQRARFTLAHEIGHIWLKHAGMRYRGKSGALQEKYVRQIKQQEREADRFAGAFLAPSCLAGE
jgi:hypothetical protein